MDRKWAILYSDLTGSGVLEWQLKGLYEHNAPEDFFLFIHTSPAVVGTASLNDLIQNYISRHGNIIVCEEAVTPSLIQRHCGTPVYLMTQSERFFWACPGALHFLEKLLSQEYSMVTASLTDEASFADFLVGQVNDATFTNQNNSSFQNAWPAVLCPGKTFAFEQRSAAALETLLATLAPHYEVKALTHKQSLVAFRIFESGRPVSSSASDQKNHCYRQHNLPATYGEFFHRLLSDSVKRLFAAYLLIAENRFAPKDTLHFTKSSLEDPNMLQALVKTLIRLKASGVHAEIAIDPSA